MVIVTMTEVIIQIIEFFFFLAFLGIGFFFGLNLNWIFLTTDEISPNRGCGCNHQQQGKNDMKASSQQ